MADEWNKYAAILEREDKEFRRAMEKEEALYFPLKLAMNTEFWLGWMLLPSVR